jgi:hypothetical protein
MTEQEEVILTSEEAASIQIEDVNYEVALNPKPGFTPIESAAYYIFLLYCIASYFFEKHIMQISLSNIRHLYPEMEPIRQ